MTSSIIIDASFTYRLLVPGPSQSGLRALMTSWIREPRRIHAPTLWAYEITSAVTKGVRFGLFSEALGKELIDQAFQLDIEIVSPSIELANGAYEWSRRLERANAYDCFYLSLAERLKTELWTCDQKLANAVNQPWVRYAENPSAI